VKVLLIDNFDSFTYNLYQYLAEMAHEVTVVRNDHAPLDALRTGRFTHIVISPGPGNPTDPAYFGDCRQVIEEFHGAYPLLGVCLGHQGIGAYFGAAVVRAPKIMHGKTSTFKHSGQGLFAGLPDEVTVMRYHSLALDPVTLPTELIVDARTADGTIMAFRHRTAPTYGLQFHPESFGTPEGMQMLKNFLKTRFASKQSS
jgi:anthranilate synthase/aminodeoxychorismate synthase-like glutamine amidotransferase